jgi:hypothetical protein
MNPPLADRLGAASGVAGSALLFGGLLVANAPTDAISVADVPATIAESYLANPAEIRLGVVLALAGVFPVDLVPRLPGRVRAAENDGGWVGSVLCTGGTIGLAGVLAHLGILVAATNESIAGAPETAHTLLILDWDLVSVLAPAYGGARRLDEHRDHPPRTASKARSRARLARATARPRPRRKRLPRSSAGRVRAAVALRSRRILPGATRAFNGAGRSRDR